MVLPATTRLGFKDPVVRRTRNGWDALVCAHLLDETGAEDRMRTVRARSDDGWSWVVSETAIEGRVGRWDERGARVTAVLPNGTVLYDGRRTAMENWFERSGVAAADASGRLVPDDDAEVLDVRYVEALVLPDGSTRVYWEERLPDLTHELRTSLHQPARLDQE